LEATLFRKSEDSPVKPIRDRCLAAAAWLCALWIVQGCTVYRATLQSLRELEEKLYADVLWAAPMIVLATAVGVACWWCRRPAHPQLKKATLLAALDVYKAAWEQQDSKLILTIFTKDAIYHERVLQEPIRGHEGIAAYWQEKVLNGQDRISFALLNTYIAGTTGIAEWEVSLDDCVQRKRKHMKEIAVLEFVDGKIASLREYWASEVVGEL
jgi:ketosteroid isomerase-like protein